SEHNDGKGVKCVITFKPTLPPPAIGEKRRSNARADIVKCSTHFHENSSLSELFDAAITAIGAEARFLKFKIVAKALRTSSFTAKYSVPGRSALKDMMLNTEDHFTEMIDEVITKPKAEVKLEIVESPDNRASETAVGGGEGEKETDSRKGKKRQLPPEEETMAETIMQLKTAHHCSDRSCTSWTCFVGNPSATHIRLTPLHLQTWAAALVSHPPMVLYGLYLFLNSS
ncbi:hypothetical protein B0H16DRAFT_1313683, partial [Mycena metata]